MEIAVAWRGFDILYLRKVTINLTDLEVRISILKIFFLKFFIVELELILFLCPQ